MALLAAEPPGALLEEQVAETQQLLGSLIQRPPLTQQRLARPPVKYLRDIFVEVAAATGCGAGVFSKEELEFSLASQLAKLAFLSALVSFVATASGEPALQDVGPEGLLSGTDPGAAHLVFRGLHRAATAEACRGLWPAAAQAARSAWAKLLPEAERPPGEGAVMPPIDGPARASPAERPALEETLRPARPASATLVRLAQLQEMTSPLGAGEDFPSPPAQRALQDRSGSAEASPQQRPASAMLLEAPRLRGRAGSVPCVSGRRRRRTPTSAARAPEAGPRGRAASLRLPGMRVAGEHRDLDRWTKADALETMLKKLAAEKEALELQNGALQQQSAAQQALCRGYEAEVRNLREEWAAMAVYNRHLRATQRDDSEPDGSDDELPAEQGQLMELCRRAETEAEAIEGGAPTVPSRGQARVVQQLCDEVAALRVRSKEALRNEARAYRRLGCPASAFRELDEGTRLLEEQLRECRDAHADLARQASAERRVLEARCEELASELERAIAERPAVEARAAELDRLDGELQARAAELRAVLHRERKVLSADWAELNVQREVVLKGTAELAAVRQRAAREKDAAQAQWAAELASMRDEAAEELAARREEAVAQAAADVATELAHARGEMAAELATARERVAVELAREWEKAAAEIATKRARAAAEAAAKATVHLAGVKVVVAAEIANAAEREKAAAESAVDWQRVVPELAAERDKVAAELSAEREKAAAELAAERQRVVAELAAERQSAAAELAAERQRVVAELAAERQSAAAELAAERQSADAELAAERLKVAAELAAERQSAAAELTAKRGGAAVELAAERQSVAAEHELAAERQSVAAEHAEHEAAAEPEMEFAHKGMIAERVADRAIEEEGVAAERTIEGERAAAGLTAEKALAEAERFLAEESSVDKASGIVSLGSAERIKAHFHLVPSSSNSAGDPADDAGRACSGDAPTDASGRSLLAAGAARPAPLDGAGPVGARGASPEEGAEEATPVEGAEQVAEGSARTEDVGQAVPPEVVERPPASADGELFFPRGADEYDFFVDLPYSPSCITAATGQVTPTHAAAPADVAHGGARAEDVEEAVLTWAAERPAAATEDELFLAGEGAARPARAPPAAPTAPADEPASPRDAVRRSSSSQLAASLVASAAPVLPQDGALRMQRASSLPLEDLERQLQQLRAHGGDGGATGRASSGGSSVELR